MQDLPSHPPPTPSKRDSVVRPMLLASGFLAIAIGAFALTLPGIWIWIGAALWALAGIIFTASLIKHVTNPTPQSNLLESLERQILALDGECENLQDQNWELRETEQKYQTLLNRQGDIILHLKGDGSLHFANDAFARYFDLALNGSPFQPDPATTYAEATQGADPLWERKIETLEGPRWFRWTETLMRSANTQDEVEKNGLRLVIARDVSAFKRVEAASEAKSRFLATISHEMRTPLNGIIGMANQLESTPLTAEQSSYNQALRQSGTALLALVNDVLDLSRIEAGKLTMRHEWTSPTRLMEDVVELLAPDAQDKGLSVASWVGQTVPAKMLIDPVRVRQILVNLLGNAIKFTEEGAINLSLDCATPPNEGEAATLVLSVRDTGPGIAEDMIARLFEEFEQADQSPTRAHDGAGLGLAISRRLARMMNGDIEVISKDGKGSTFTLKLSAEWLGEQADEADSGGISDPVDNFKQAAAQLHGDLLVGIDLTQADQRALFSYCQDWHIEFCHFTLEEWEDQGNDLAPNHLLINGVEPDKVAQIVAGFDPLKGGRLTRPLPQSRVILLEPAERRVIPQMRDIGISAYLVKPVRQISLHQALLGHPSLRADEEVPSNIAPAEPQEDAPTLITEPKAKAQEDAPHILLVEDNDINALLARTVLQKAGMTVTLAKSGKEALAEYEDPACFDLALLDLHMPDMDGEALFDAMKQRESDDDNPLPKIAFTADALEETRDRCLAHGFDAFLVKPVDPQDLVATVKGSLHRARKRHNSVL